MVRGNERGNLGPRFSLALAFASIVLLMGAGNLHAGSSIPHDASLASAGQIVTSQDAPSYFPLHDKDRWVYVVTPDPSGNPPPVLPPPQPGVVQTVEITSSNWVNGRSIYELSNYLFPLSTSQSAFYNDAPGSATELWNGQNGVWYPWWEFSGQEEVPITIPDFFDDCIHGAQGYYTGLSTVTVPAGTFEQAATISYDFTPCYHGYGLNREVFAPDVGLIQRSVRMATGVMTWSLAYAKVGGHTWGEVPGNNRFEGVQTAAQGSKSSAVRTTTWGAIKSTFSK